jgi:hypothetical protein
MFDWLREYGLACGCVVGTYLLFLCAVGVSWWVAAIATVFSWGVAGWMCYMASCPKEWR